MGGVGHRFQGVAVEEGEVGVEAGLQGSNFVIESEDLGGIEGAGGEGNLLRKSVGGGEGGLEVDHAGLRDIGFVAGLEGEGDSFLMELGREGEGHVFEITERPGHGGVDDDRNAGGLDFIEEKVGFGSPVEDEIEAKFLAETEGGGDILVTVGIDEERGLFAENIGEDLEFEIGIGGVFLLGLGFADFGSVRLSLEEFGAEEGDRFGTGAGGFSARGQGIGTQGGRDGGSGNESVFERGDGGDVGLHHHELAGDEGAG